MNNWKKKLLAASLGAAMTVSTALPVMADSSSSSLASSHIHGNGFSGVNVGAGTIGASSGAREVPIADYGSVNAATAGSSSSGSHSGAGMDATADPVDAVIDPADGGTAEAPIDAKVSRQKAIELANSYVQIPADYKLQSVSYNTETRITTKRGVWRLSYQKTSDNRYYANINVSIDADNGELLRFNSYVSDPNQIAQYPPKVELNEAKKIAMSFIEKMSGDRIDQLKYDEEAEKMIKTPLNGDVRYELRYNRVENNVVFQQNYIQVTVNGDGHITNYELRWDDGIEFADVLSLINQQKAEAAFLEQMNPYLQFVFPYNVPNSQGSKKAYVSYLQQPFYLDARTGEKRDYGNSSEVNTKVPLSKEPLADLPKSNLNLTSDQAVEVVRKIVQIPSNAKLQESSYYERTDEFGNQSAGWNLYWVWDQADTDADGKTSLLPAGDIYAFVDSRSGELKNFYMYKRLEDSEEKGSKEKIEQAKVVAQQFVKKMVPHHAHELYLQERDISLWPITRIEETREFYFNFRRIVGGVLTPSDSVSVSVNLQTGDVTQYSNNLSSYSYESPANIISEEDAKELLLSSYDVKLGYILPGEGGYDIYGRSVTVDSDGVQEHNKAIPVYHLVPVYTDESFFLDAQDGKWRSQETGNEISLERQVATDIEGHWAERQLELMIEYRALDVENGKVNPSKQMTRGEMIKMLVIAMNGGNYRITYDAQRKASFNDVANGSSYFAYVETAVDRNLIDTSSESFNPDAPMTREEMAELIVRALGYNKLAEYDGMFIVEAYDSREVERRGQVAIVVGLGIMSLNNGNFLPDQKVTRAQAAVAFYKYLEQRSKLQDVPLYY